MKAIACAPCAKVNLGLQIVARRDDGFHDLRTVFLPIHGYHDTMSVEFCPSGESSLSLALHGYEVTEPVENNLIYRAYEALRPFSPLPAAVQLRKQIPMGAGLGGGSSDAASALRCFAEHCRTPILQPEIERMALMLGSDVPFFLQGYPCYAEGRGELLEPIALPLRGMYIMVITPPLHVSTREAFKMVTPCSERDGLKEILLDTPIHQWRSRVENDFWRPLSARHPQLLRIEQRLYEQGAIFATLSGSGPSVYGLFEEPCIAAESTFTNCRVYSGRLL